MKKHLSIFFLAIASIIVISSVTSCVTKEDVSINSKNLIGTWERISASSLFPGVAEFEGTMYVQFKKDGTYIEVSVDIEENDVDISRWKWSLSGNTLIFEFEGELEEEEILLPSIFTITESTKNSLTLVGVGGIITVNLKRVSDSTIEKYL